MADDEHPASATPGEGSAAAPAPVLNGDDQFVSLYRRFRPGRFGDLRGQEHVVRALQGATREGRVAHAYLFSGPHGTGKTSSARILARALNCANPVDGEPCGVCASCTAIAQGTSMDVHELDAASNNGVDAMRDLIAHAALSTPGRWKVYIVDEVHMLSNAAANALLKTLEEPPGHLVFVLATTDPQKVPPTIRSRTQHFEFGLLGPETMTSLLRDVNAAAGLSLDESDLSVAVRKARGSARDALSAMDQVAASGSADALRPEVDVLAEAIADSDATGALVAVARLGDAGWGPQQLATELVDELRQTFLASLAPELCAAVGPERERLAERSTRMGLARVVRAIEHLGRAQVDMREAPDPRAVLEVTMARLAHPELDETVEALLDRMSRLERAIDGAPVSQSAPASRAAAPAQSAASAGAQAERSERPGASGPAHVPRPPAPSAPPAPAPPPSGPVAERPGLGALRRERSSQGVPGAPAPAPQDVPPAPAPPSPAPAPVPQRTTASGAAPASGSRPDREAPDREMPDRDALVEAWGDHVLRALPGGAKALFGPGRFVAVDGATAEFALPNAAHRDAAEARRPDVERALSAHFGVRISLRLSVDEAQAPRAVGGPGPRPSARPSPGGPGRGPAPEPEDGLDPDDEIDPNQPTGSAESAAKERLLQAFPGAEEVS